MSTPATVLIVDDDEAIRELVRGYLERDGLHVLESADGEAALALVREGHPDVVILDLMLPGIDGVEVCRRLRTFSDAYVLMLTARAEEIDRIVGLRVGADDYVTKPFSPRELVVRVRVLLRRPRTAGATDEILQTGELGLDLGRRSATLRGIPVTLTTIEFDLLAALLQERGRVLTRQQLLDRVWGADFVGDDHLVDVHIANLRRKLGDDPELPSFIETVRGVGYRAREEA